MPAECNCLFLGAPGSFTDKLLGTGREGGRRVKSGHLKGGMTPLPPDNAPGYRGRRSKMLRGLNIMNSHSVFAFPLPGCCLVLYCLVLYCSCSEQHVNCCFTSPANISKLQRRQRARPQPWPGVYGQMECELWVRKKRGSNNEASPLCWLFVWTDRLSHSTSCGWNTNGYD